MSETDRVARQGASPDEASTLVVRLALASLCVAAGAIHLVMVPQHSQESTLDGIMFLVGGWAQIGLAVALLAWPRKAVLQATVVVNLLAVITWTISRTDGLPFGANPGVKEPAGTVDQICTVFEALAVLVALAVLIRPELWRSLNERVVVVGAVVAVAVVAATSVVLTSPDAANHHNAEDASSANTQLVSASERCDLGFNPASYWQEATTAGFDTVAGGLVQTASSTTAAAPAADGHAHSQGSTASATAAPAAPVASKPAIASINEGRGSADLDRVMALSTKAGEGAEAQLVSTLADISDDDYEAWLGRVTGTATHAGPQGWVAMTDQDECDTLAGELEEAQEFALAHPTPVEAREAGYTRVTGYVPGIASHWMNFGYVDDTFDLTKPEMLLYDGDEDDASVVGLSYYITMDAEIEPTQGFTGDEDRYHVHSGLCVGQGGVIGDSTTTDEECAARGGRKALGSGNWMSHAWVVPGCESPWGVFSGNNPLLDPTLGDASGEDGGGCAGSGVLDRYDIEPGTSSNTPTTVNGSDVQVAAP
jgi:hypothetical protein